MQQGTTSLESPALYLTQQAFEKYQSDRPMDLLSAGLFLRMATEARLLQYRNSRKDFPRGISPHKIKAWRREIEKKFQTKNLVVQWNWGNNQLYYVPVSDRQELLSAQISNWLHFGQKHFDEREKYIEESREVVKELLELSMICCCGNLLGPPLPSEANEQARQFTIHIPQEDIDYIEENPDLYQNRLNEFVPKSYSGNSFHLIHKLPDEYRIQKLKRFFGVES